MSGAGTLQSAYYARTADRYEELHDEREHREALAWLIGWALENDVSSVLDVGAGTGAGVARLRRRLSGARVLGVEPVAAMRAQAARAGLPGDALVEGDACALQFADGEFDIVSAFGVMHHLERPQAAIAEMLRVASRAVFISDVNNFADGASAAKLALRAARLWGAAVKLKTRGRGWHFSETDGLAYSYSLLSSLPSLSGCELRVMTTRPYRGPNLLRSATHMAVLAIRS
jgi:ubiquinone/menaquinone biosynthesis C-methylase UbiE